jgi:hypothetical protein
MKSKKMKMRVKTKARTSSLMTTPKMNNLATTLLLLKSRIRCRGSKSHKMMRKTILNKNKKKKN